MPLPPGYDPDLIGFLEKAGWHAYYERDWINVLRHMTHMNRSAFGMSWPVAILAAIDTMRAAIAFAPIDNDLSKTRQLLLSFYNKARRSSGIPATVEQLADLELAYWVIHRQLALKHIQHPSDQEIEPLIGSLASLHAAIFDSTPAQMRASAELRARAAATVDEITSMRSQDIPGDWQQIEQLLQEAYRAVALALR